MIWQARCLSFFMGFLSLSQEILWVRMAGFAYRGAPQAFGVILGVYLLGIALGAGLGKRFCAEGRDLLRLTSGILSIAAVLDVAFPWLTVSAFGFGRAAGTVVLMGCVFVTAMLKSMIFPIAHHLGSSTTIGKVGSSVSKVYFSNIVGSTLGPLVTGFVLLHVLTLQQCFLLMGGLTLLTSAYCWRISGERNGGLAISASMVTTLLLMLTPGLLVVKLVENTGNREGPFKAAIENRYGIIHILESEKSDDYVFGGNAYDGRINIDFMADTNWISRVYALAAVQPQPKRVLVIGMSAGAWTRVVSAFPYVEKIDVVEINPGYTSITERYDATKSVLSDPKVQIHFDDGRRWLKRNPDEQYDLIVVNTTYHFRAYASMLLSQDFLAEVKQHMNPGAVMAYNSTYSWDVFRTASVRFSNVYRYGNFVVAGDGISVPNDDEAIRRIAALRTTSGRALVDINDVKVLDKLRRNLREFKPYNEAELEALAKRPLEVITDQNMLTEYKYGESILGYLMKKK
jgi:spermidine synthase